MNTIGANTIFGGKVLVPFWESFFAGLPALMFALALAILLIYGWYFICFLIDLYKEKHLPVISQDTPYD
jgi:ABC-type uncharacterized transport system permease subunit